MSRTAILTAAAASVLAGIALAFISVAELLRYSPYENPGAGKTGGYLGIAAVILILGPVVAAALAIAGAARRAHRAYLASLPPEYRTAAYLGEAVAMAGAGVLWAEHNRREDARLSASVMGDERKDQI